MNIIVPMAGIGKRMRPFTLSVPKPLFPIAGKTIVQHLIEEIISLAGQQVEEIAFITGNFGVEVERNLLAIAAEYKARGKIYYQTEALGTAHAIYCAKDSMKGEVIIAYADTIFKSGNLSIDNQCDGTIFVKEVEDPSAYGVVVTDKNNRIIQFVEKPKDHTISKDAIIGIYHFRDGEMVKKEIEFLLDNNITVSGEFQFTTALENLIQKGKVIRAGVINQWMDCGNHKTTLDTSNRILELYYHLPVNKSESFVDSILMESSFIDEISEIKESIIGSRVSIGKNCRVKNCIIKNSIVLDNSVLENRIIENSIVGNNVILTGRGETFVLGDFSIVN